MKFSDYGIILNESGRDQQRLSCPECTPHRKKQNLKDLAVSVSDGIWYCHHCGWKGSLNVKRISEVAMHIPKKIYKKPEKIKNYHIEDNVVDYFAGRGISVDTLIKCGVTNEKIFMPQTSQEENCVVFNYFLDGKLINKKYRDGKKNMRMSKDAELILYAPLAKDNFKYSGDLYITEGEPDCLTMIELGYNNTVSPPNGAPPENTDIANVDFSYMESLKQIFPGYKRVFLIMDNDSVGARFRDEIARRIGYERCFKAEYPEGCKDINNVLKDHGKDEALKVINNCKPYPISGKHDVSDLYGDVIRLYESGFEAGMSTGFMNLDRYYKVRQKEFTVVTGIPSHGKSSFLDHVLVNLASSKNWSFAIFSPENFPFERHIAKFCEIYIGKPFDKHYNGHMSEQELEKAVKWCNDHFHFIMPGEDDNQTLDKILSLSRASIFKDGVNGIVIDPWNEIEHDLGREPETVYISKSLSKIRKFSRINNVHTWIVAHPTKLQKKRDGSYPIPTPYDIAGSAHFRNKADNCICVNRDFETDVTEILVQKIRFKEIGKVGKAKLVFNLANGRFKDTN